MVFTIICQLGENEFSEATVYSGYSGHVYSGHSDIVATFPGTKYIYSIIFMSDIVARKGWPKVATISEVHCIVQSSSVRKKLDRSQKH